MVEMLGVLAVIGVLSVAGIAAYSTAMTKHRANELLYEASKRASIIATQAMQGRTTYSIEEFTNNETLGFTGAVENPDNTNQFNLTLSDVDEDVCTQMKASIGTHTPVRKMAPDCLVITYNKDLSAASFGSDFASEQECTDGGKTWCSGLGTSGTCSDNSDCCAGITLNECQESCDSETGTITTKEINTPCHYSSEETEDGVCNNEGMCVVDSCQANGATNYLTACINENGKNGYCISGACQMDSCFSNEDCNTTLDSNGNNKEYCQYAGYYSDSKTTDTVSADGSIQRGGYKGTCQSVGTPVSGEVSSLGMVYGSPANVYLNYWSAVNYCNALGGASLLDLSSNPLQCYNASQVEMDFSVKKDSGLCCKSDNTTCDNSNLSLAMQEIVGQFSQGKRIWTKTRIDAKNMYFLDSSNNSTKGLVAGAWLSDSARSYNYTALCVK